MSTESPRYQPPSDDEIRSILTTMRRVAVVGVSAREDRDSHGIAKFLQEKGLDMLPVNPTLDHVLGHTVYPDLKTIEGPIDVVDIFRRSDAVPPIVEEAIAVGAKVVWMQLGVVNEDAASAALAAGLQVVMDLCIYQEWLRLMNR
jgi:predicted CoA-binding protein